MSSYGVTDYDATYPTPYGWLMDPEEHEIDAHAFEQYTDDEEDAFDTQMWSDDAIEQFEDREDLEFEDPINHDYVECDNCLEFVPSVDLIASRTYGTVQMLCKRCVAVALEEW